MITLLVPLFLKAAEIQIGMKVALSSKRKKKEVEGDKGLFRTALLQVRRCQCPSNSHKPFTQCSCSLIHAKVLVITTLLRFLKRTFHIGENFSVTLN